MQDLSPETRSLLHRLSKESQHHRVRQRAHGILLSFQGIHTTALMAIFSVDRLTLYHGFDAWEVQHCAGLYDKKRCGRPPKLTEEDQGKAQHYLTEHPRDRRKVVHLVGHETSKLVSTKTLKRLVKKTAMSGSASKRLLRKVLLHSNMSEVKRSSSHGKIENVVAQVSYGILMGPAFA